MFWVDEGHAVYETVSRMSHSCLPNCCEQFYGRSVACRTILPVVAGQELTIEYNSAHCWKPTHVRRQIYCTKKQFTCRCPRCDAEGDDTRLFDCFDPQCHGSHLVCEPLNREIIPFGVSNYTGVEYVEPHLLPCTVCHRAPPLKYQEDMFKLETQLYEAGNELEEEVAAFAKSMGELFDRVQSLHMPRGHSLTVGLLRSRYNIAALMNQHIKDHPTTDGKKGPPLIETCARDLVQAIERRSRFPSALESAHLLDTCFVTHFSAEYSRAFALECCQKALRIYLILHGRDCERNKYNDLMVELLDQLPPQPATTTECMFCGESPLRAAITLSRCGRCKQVTYCSAGCQKAHWPLHKKICKSTV